jgi:hypothetical protein
MLGRLLAEKDTWLAREEETVADLRRRVDDAHAKLQRSRRRRRT